MKQGIGSNHRITMERFKHMNIIRNSVGKDHSSLSYSGMLIAVLPNDFVQNVMQGFERIIDSCNADKNCEEYQLGYVNGTEDAIKEICSHLFDKITFCKNGTQIVFYEDLKEILIKVDKNRKMLFSDGTKEELPREDLE